MSRRVRREIFRQVTCLPTTRARLLAETRLGTVTTSVALAFVSQLSGSDTTVTEADKRHFGMLTRGLLAVVVAIMAVAAVAPRTAQADPDRHVPDLSAGYCPGGKQGRYHSPTGYGYCDGMHFPDGSYWHMVQLDSPGQPTKQCVINPDGSFMPRPAPLGGCGGAVR